MSVARWGFDVPAGAGGCRGEGPSRVSDGANGERGSGLKQSLLESAI